MLLPIRTSIRPGRTPYANYALIIINVFVFFLTYWPHDSIVGGYRVIEPLRPWADQFMLTPGNLHLWQFISYAFLHGNFLHIFGNMFFLYLFGNNVNDKLGSSGYLGFYLAGAVFSGIGHILLNSSPAIGASGAVAAVTGAYLVLFPQTLVTVVYWFIFIGTMDVPALYFIAIKMIFIDNIIDQRTPNVAYDAHLAGYGFGILSVLIMLATSLIRGSSFDLWSMLKRWNQRRHYRDVVSGGYDPFSAKTGAKQIKVKEVKKTAAEQKKARKISELRSEIASRISQHNLPAAAEIYVQLMGIDSKNILPRQQLLDIANQLAGDNRPAESARTYEQFLTHYKNYEYIEQVQLMLGILYSRYLDEPKLAVQHLQAAVDKLSDPGQLKMCNDELTKLQN